jgi:hypothetical protein
MEQNHPLQEQIKELTADFLSVYTHIPPKLVTTLDVMVGDYALLMVRNELNVAFDIWTQPSMN